MDQYNPYYAGGFDLNAINPGELHGWPVHNPAYVAPPLTAFQQANDFAPSNLYETEYGPYDPYAFRRRFDRNVDRAGGFILGSSAVVGLGLTLWPRYPTLATKFMTGSERRRDYAENAKIVTNDEWGSHYTRPMKTLEMYKADYGPVRGRARWQHAGAYGTANQTKKATQVESHALDLWKESHKKGEKDEL